ncbi:MAG: alcohol dehydrogenase catalytic domain-containing protein [Candidatus Omnitrophica bacterium]|nr:alcohol dehydrogenase catalytic domain-containing protein [Candidatus Omnitrophota bacterium]
MRVAMYYSNNDVRLEEMPKPEAGPGELLIEIHASGICGSDVLEWYRIDKVPLVLGHEIAGEIVAVGEGLKGFKPGNRVSASHHVPCGKCHYCLRGHESVCDTLRKTKFYPGGFSEYVKLPAENIELGGVYSLPEGLSYEEATFTEPLACVLRGQRLAGMQKADTVLVLGCGTSGLLHLQLARRQGAHRVIATDVVDFRLKKAEELGADKAVCAKDYTPDYLRKVNEGRLADLVVLCTGAPSAIKQAFESVDKGGTILFFAAAGKDFQVPLPINEVFWRNEITLTSSYAGSGQDHRDALRFISEGAVNVKDMITHRFGLKDAGEGFKLVAEAGDCLKVVVEPQEV